jgi:hypothetical protein
VGERGFAEAGRSAKKQMFERIVALARRANEDVELLLDARLADELVRVWRRAWMDLY